MESCVPCWLYGAARDSHDVWVAPVDEIIRQLELPSVRVAAVDGAEQQVLVEVRGPQQRRVCGCRQNLTLGI